MHKTVVKNERMGAKDMKNWTDGDGRPRGIEMGVIFSAFLQQESWSIFITIFKNRIFFVLRKQKPSFFRAYFWYDGSGRVAY